MMYSIVVLFVMVIFLAMGWWKEAELTNELSKYNEQIKQEARDAREEKRILLTQISGIIETKDRINHE